jgi:hypothetical protein
MSRLYIYCEGHTEKIFVDKILVPFLGYRGIVVQTIMAARGIGGNRGGIAQYNQVKRELTNICNEHPNEHVTTLIDYSPVFGLPFEYDTSGTIYDSVTAREHAIEKDIGLPNLIMNFELHEFEAFLYCNPEAFQSYGKKSPAIIRKIVQKANGPELINTDVNTLPSKRLDAIIPKYTKSKMIHTRKLLEHITLDQIRSECKHFDNWLKNVCDVCAD